MKTVNAIILSGACCNPGLSGLDEKIQARINEVAAKIQVQSNISVIPISTAAFGGLGLSKEIDETIRGLIAAKGMSILPVVILNGKIAFYGGLASSDMIENVMQENGILRRTID